MSQYPRWVHHKEHKDKLIQSAEEHKLLGEGWGDDSSVWRSPPMEAIQEVASEAQIEKEEPIEKLPQSAPEKSGKKGKKDRKQSA